MNAQVISQLMPLIKSRESEFVADSLQSDIKSTIESIAENFIAISSFATIVSRDNANSVTNFGKASFLATFERSMGVDVEEVIRKERIKGVIDKHVRENVRLIKSIPKEYFKRIENTVLSGVTNGLRSEAIARQLFTQGKDAKTRGVLGMTKRRAKLIARDQSAKLSGQINRTRQTNLGITEYVWRSAEDDRVRPTHVEQDGQTYSWKDKNNRPLEGLDPGEPINCRCIAQAVVTL